MIASAALALAAVALSAPPAAPKFEIRDGDRIVWIGSTLVEREQRYGYWETALHAAFPDSTFTLRNLGWSGDTVLGESRGRFDFDKPDAGFKQLVDLTLELKPTVIFVSYGANESFEGEAGLEKFEKGLEKLLDALKPAKARIVLFTPMPFESSTSLDAAKRNKSLQLYREAIWTVAAKRDVSCVELYDAGSIAYYKAAKTNEQPWRLTENGVHLSQEGYREMAGHIVDRLSSRQIALSWKDLDPLRQAIVAKNQLFFYRWRPQNETYLFGFRKHEQGKNAKEVAEFDPLVAEAEKKIESLRKSLEE